MRSKLFASIVGATLLAGLVGAAPAGARPQSIDSLSVQGFVEDQTCINGDTVQVDLSAVSESSSQPVKYRWDLNNDGKFDTKFKKNPDVTAFYGDELNITVRVKAKNPEGDRDTDSVTFGTLRCEH